MKQILNRRRLQCILQFLPFVLLFILSIQVNAQKRKPQNLPKLDYNFLNFGFALGINSTNFIVVQDPAVRYNDTLYVVESAAGSGFNLGIVSEMKMGEYSTLRFTPSLSFTERTLHYRFMIAGKETPSQKPVESTFIEMPLEIKLRSARINNYRMYLLAGVKYSIDMASQKKVVQNNPDPYKTVLKIERNDYGYSIGFGLDCYLHFFRFSPEIKMYHGIPNLIVHDGKVFSQSILNLRSKIFLLSFIFE